MIDQASALRDAFTEAYPPFLENRLAARDLANHERLQNAIDEGRQWLRAALDDLLGLPFGQQPRGPLELFQQAMQFPTDALEALGVAPLERDSVVANALPGDRYGLAPVASHELGETAWRAHLAWGAAKAAALQVVGPVRVGVLSRNLMDRSKLDAALENAGYDVVVLKDALADDLSWVIIDLEHPRAHSLIEMAVAAGDRSVVYAPHVDRQGMESARTAGAMRVVPRSQVFVNPGEFVATLSDG